MKFLPCSACDDGRAKEPNGKPLVIGRAPADITRRPFRYVCAAHVQRPKSSFAQGPPQPTVYNEIAIAEFNRLPEATLAELREVDLDWMVLNDLKGAGVTDEQIEELEAAGVDFASLHSQPGER